MVRLTDRPDTTLDVYRGRKTTTQQQQLVAAHQSVPALYGMVCETVHLVQCHKGVQWIDPDSDYPDQKPIFFFILFLAMNPVHIYSR